RLYHFRGLQMVAALVQPELDLVVFEVGNQIARLGKTQIGKTTRRDRNEHPGHSLDSRRKAPLCKPLQNRRPALCVRPLLRVRSHFLPGRSLGGPAWAPLATVAVLVIYPGYVGSARSMGGAR